MPFLHNSKKSINLNRISDINGLRYFIISGNGKYVGEVKNNLKDGYGVKFQKNQLIYDGSWKNGQRDSHGRIYKKLTNCTKTVYVGNFENDKKNGEGKRFYKFGTYDGFWKDDKKCGLGIMWYKNGSLYMGEWDEDTYNGAGVLFEENQNSYEGFFKKGLKHGRGTFYHNNTGQIQKGIWIDNICKSSVIQDEFRNSVISPTHYPIPSNKLKCPNTIFL